MKPLDVYVWQFGEEKLVELPDFFRVVPVSLADLPVDAPLLVPVTQWQSFADAIAAETVNPLPDAILYLQRDIEDSDEAASYFDAVIREGDWETLRRYAQHPQQFRLAEQASQLSKRLLDRLPHPLTRDDVRRLPLPEDVRRLLRNDDVYLETFNEAVAGEREIRWALNEPTIQDLADYIRGHLSLATEPYILAFLKRSVAGRAKFNVLRRQLVEDALLEAPFVPESAAEEDQLPADNGDVRRPLFLVALSLWLARVRPRNLGKFRGEVPTDQSPPEPAASTLLAAVLEGEIVTLVYGTHEFALSFDADNNLLIIEKLQLVGGEAKNVFFVELRSDDEIVWEGQSIGGRIAIPLGVLQRILPGAKDLPRQDSSTWLRLLAA